MNLSCVTIQAGLQRPVRLLHLSDTHLCFADDRDCQRKRDLAASRIRYFSGSNETLESYLDEAVAFAQKANSIAVTRPGAQSSVPFRKEVGAKL